MDIQNSKGSSSSAPSRQSAILEHGTKVKKEIQSTTYELIAILKKREHDLCLEVDQLCLQQIKKEEQAEEQVLDEAKKKLDAKEQLYFKGSIKYWQRQLKNYGHLFLMDPEKIEMENNIQPPKEAEFKSLPSYEVKIFAEELDEKASTVSTDSFEVIEPNSSVKALLEEKEDFIAKMHRWQGVLEEHMEESRRREKLEKEARIAQSTQEEIEAFDKKFKEDQDYCQMVLDEVEKNFRRRLQERLEKDRIRREERQAAAMRELEMMNAVAACSGRSRAPVATLPREVLRSTLKQAMHSTSEKSDILRRQNEWLACLSRSFQEVPNAAGPASSCRSLPKVHCTSSNSGNPAIQDTTTNPGNTSENPENAIRAGFAAYLQKDNPQQWVTRNRNTSLENRNASSEGKNQSPYAEWVAREKSGDASEPTGDSTYDLPEKFDSLLLPKNPK